MDYIDSTLPNEFVYDFEKKQTVAFPSAQPFTKLYHLSHPNPHDLDHVSDMLQNVRYC